MKRAAVLRGLLGTLVVMTAAFWSGYSTTAQTTTPQPPKTSTEAGAPPELLSINVVHVKPELLTEWEDFQRKEVIPTLQKGGVKLRDAWRTAIGEAYEFAFVSPLANFAARDDSSPIVKALGEEGARAYGSKSRRFVASSRSYVVRIRPDLSYAGEWAPTLAVLSTVSIAPGRMTDYTNFIKNEILPVQKQAQAPYLVSQTVFGGDANEVVALSLVKTFADLDKGPATVRVLGPEAAAKLTQKTAGLVMHAERMVIRYVPDLSFKVATATSSK
jgi:hypothetical protein